MNDVNLGSAAAELIRTCPYANIATSFEDTPWNTPVSAVADDELNFYWSSWVNAVHSQNLIKNPNVFLTLYDSTRPSGTNNFKCLYLQGIAVSVTAKEEIRKAHELVYPGKELQLEQFSPDPIKNFYKAIPKVAWLNCLSVRNLTPSTIKMRVEVSIEEIRRYHQSK
ncbi:pyridoxamine 5'-phosphate oxidase family protein [Microcoleus sp. N3A4]|uniref:pyridoxamine 5'-phosphate oxidase family protein n=1 Tax=Microcoleus sp. N3A4 TaxID=3055379 RepID=UPI002FCF964D